MREFRFRAQAALDLRRRQFDAARRELADAERVRDEAQGRVAAASEALRAARDAGSARAHRAGTITDCHWYRFWILRLEHERNADVVLLASKQALVDAVRVACRAAQQRCQSLERFRERALEKHQAAEAALERKLVDELATRRFVLGSRAFQGVSS
jgi:flagellar export protein FliJ